MKHFATLYPRTNPILSAQLATFFRIKRSRIEYFKIEKHANYMNVTCMIEIQTPFDGDCIAYHGEKTFRKKTYFDIYNTLNSELFKQK